MVTPLDNLPIQNRQELQAVTKIIADSMRPEKIFLFGTYTTKGLNHEFFSDLSFPVNYDILVITRRHVLRAEYEIQDMLENRCKFHALVSILVHDIEYVNEKISDGHYFFITIRKEAILLYDAQMISLTEAKPLDLEAVRATAVIDFNKWYTSGNAFLKTALFAAQEKEFNIAAFLLHQAVEHAYRAILMVNTGYRPCTHNIDKLRRYTYRFSIELALTFPRNTDKEEHLFRLLVAGYVESRDNENYSISEDELAILLNRVEKILVIAFRVCNNRILVLQKMSNSNNVLRKTG